MTDPATAGAKDLKAEGLDLITRGLTEALDELKELGMVGEAGAGRGFSDLALSGLELGVEDVTATFKSFCERWEWGVRSLINEGNAFALGVDLSAGTYYETDQYVENTLKVGVNSLIGNPYASEEEVIGKGWGDITTSGVLGGPDYSADSWEEAHANVKQGWKDAGRDIMTSRTGALGLNPENLHGATGMSDAEYDQWLNDTFGPSPEARAKAADPGSGES